MKKKLLIASLSIAICFGQELGVGDTIPSDFGLPLCANEYEPVLDENNNGCA